MEVSTEQLRERYKSLETDELVDLHRNSDLTFGQDYGVEFSIEKDNELFKYQLHRLALSNIEFVGWGPFTKRVFRAQLRLTAQSGQLGLNKNILSRAILTNRKNFHLCQKMYKNV